MGGEIVLSFVTEFPERVRRAVVGGAGWVEAEGAKYEGWRQGATALAALEPGDVITERLLPDAVFDEYTTRTLNSDDPLAASAVSSGMLDLALEERTMRTNQVPVLLLIGENDEFKYTADAALRVGSNMHMHVLPNQDHVSALRDPAFAVAIRDFLVGS